jgi:hypothetical protein
MKSKKKMTKAERKEGFEKNAWFSRRETSESSREKQWMGYKTL